MGDIVVGYDGSAQALAAVEWAAAEAQRHGGAVEVLESWHEPVLSTGSLAEAWLDPGAGEAHERAVVEAVLEERRAAHPGVAFSVVITGEPPASALMGAGDRADMVVVGARGLGGFSGLLLGSVSQRVAAGSASTVVVVRDVPDPLGPVVVGVDGSAASRAALRWAADQARAQGSALHVVMAWHPLAPVGEHGREPLRAGYTADDADEVVAAITAQVLDGHPGIDVEVEAVCESATRALVERGASASLLVVGAGASATSSGRFGGSVCAQLLHHAPCPLAVVR